MRQRRSRLAGVVLVVLAGCDAGAPVVPAPSRAMFAGEVYPILLRDCAFAGCHGDPLRSWHLVGPGRVRLDPDMDLLDAATEAELEYSYERTRAMLLRSAGEGSDIVLLLRKPVEGGAHKGRDHNGRNVYEDAEDPSLATIAAWAAGAEAL